MDIQRKCFEESNNVNPDWSFKFDEELQQYIALDSEMELQVDEFNEHWDTFRAAWQAAKAHEAEKLKGCVMVPVQCPDPDFADSLFDELSKKAIGEFGDDLLIHFSDIDEEKIWALMVEAAKAQAVPEGFVLVSQKELMELAIAINAVDLATHTEEKPNEVREMWQQVALKLMALGTAQEPSND